MDRGLIEDQAQLTQLSFQLLFMPGAGETGIGRVFYCILNPTKLTNKSLLQISTLLIDNPLISLLITNS